MALGVQRIWERKLIGVPDCPLFERLTIIEFRGYSLKFHRFFPNADDRDMHDHPWSFWTFVVRGGYDDMGPCETCDTKGFEEVYVDSTDEWVNLQCDVCYGRGVILRERMRPGRLRYRPSHHIHRTKVHDRGCSTIVLTFPKHRDWGFYTRRYGWLRWTEYEKIFGFGMRCDDSDLPDIESERVTTVAMPDIFNRLFAKGFKRQDDPPSR